MQPSMRLHGAGIHRHRGGNEVVADFSDHNTQVRRQ
jgi:hypothetical protein